MTDFTHGVIYNHTPRPHWWRHPIRWWRWTPEERLIAEFDLACLPTEGECDLTISFGKLKVTEQDLGSRNTIGGMLKDNNTGEVSEPTTTDLSDFPEDLE